MENWPELKKKLPEFNFDTPRTIYPFLVLQANAIKEDVGYPSFIKDDSKLDALYSMVSSSFDGCVWFKLFHSGLSLEIKDVDIF